MGWTFSILTYILVDMADHKRFPMIIYNYLDPFILEELLEYPFILSLFTICLYYMNAENIDAH